VDAKISANEPVGEAIFRVYAFPSELQTVVAFQVLSFRKEGRGWTMLSIGIHRAQIAVLDHKIEAAKDRVFRLVQCLLLRRHILVPKLSL